MANDPRRDLIPVKDVGVDKFSALSCRSKERDYNLTPATEGSYASKLDRNELENKYLRYLEENINLKKHCHNLEEKIKRLAAKLLRVVTERNLQNKGLSTPKYSDLEVEDLIGHVNELERSNQLLKDKLVVAGIQLSTHHGFVPRSAHKSPQRFGSQRTPTISSRSEFNREHGPENLPGNQVSLPSERICGNRNAEQPKNQCEFLEQEVSKLQKQLINYEKELETVREQSNTQVQVLENELARVQEEGSRMASALSAATAAAHTSARNLEQSSRRVAENVEIIRLQRHIKTQEEHLHTLEAERGEAMEGIQKLNELVNSLQRENCELKELLSDETIKVSKLHNEVEKIMKESTMKQLALEELQQEINDLKVEKAIIQDANSKIVLSIMDKIIDNVSENAPARSQVTVSEMGPIDYNKSCQTVPKNVVGDVSMKSTAVQIEKDIKDFGKMEDGATRMERDVERRVKELEDELNKKLESEKEEQMLSIQQQKKEKEFELKAKEFETQQALNAEERERLKQEVDQKEALLKSCNLKMDRLEDELRALRFQFNELEYQNIKMSENLTSKDVEIQGLEEVQKELAKKIELQTLKEYQDECEEEADISSTSSDNNEKFEAEDIKEQSVIGDEEDVESDSRLKYLDVCEKYDKIQELLQEKDVVINDYESKVMKLKCDLDVIKSKNEDLLSELKQKEQQNVIVSMNEISQPQPVRKLSVDAEKCIFEIHMDCILVSEDGVAVLRKIGEDSSSPTPSIFITWVFFEQEAAYSPLFQGPDAQLNCSYDHVMPIKPGLFEYLDEETLLVEVHAAIEDLSIPVAQGTISFRECLNYPQRMISQSTHLVTVCNKYSNKEESMSVRGDFTDNIFGGCEFGILQYRFRINCHKKCVSYYRKKKMKDKQPLCSKDGLGKAPFTQKRKGDINISSSEKQAKEEKLGSGSRFEENCRKCEGLKSPPKPAPRSLKQFPLNQSTVESEYDNSSHSVPQITIVVHSFRLMPECSVAADPNVQQLFVEYSFLGKGGENLETPISLPKPHPDEKLCFNFKRVFPMDPNENKIERNILRNMIHMKGNRRHKSTSLLAEGKVRFNVVSEPLSDDDSNAECIDIGHADVSIPKILLDGHDIIEDDVQVLNSNGTNEVIGFLNISFLAYDILQTLCGHTEF